MCAPSWGRESGGGGGGGWVVGNEQERNIAAIDTLNYHGIMGITFSADVAAAGTCCGALYAHYE